MEKLAKFEALGLSTNILQALKKKGFEEPSPIQEKTIPILLNESCDLIGQAQTGTGKTAAFGIPIIEKIDTREKSIQAMILTPTRELAIQVSEEINSLKGRKNIQIMPVYGGQSIDQQIRRLKRGIHVVVGTPGRVIDLINRKCLDLSMIRYFILDEADEMLNMGFIEDVETIFENTSEMKQVLLFSATMPNRILSLAKKYMNDYQTIAIKKEQLTTNLTEQIYFEVAESDKTEALCRLIDVEIDFYGLVFCRTKRDVDEIASKLIDRGYDAEGMHGDLSQHQRERILKKFRTRMISILVATDVAARGIDVDNLTHVINYSLPQDPESYVHRIGRTGRAGREGTAITFVTPSEYRKLVLIKKFARSEIRKESVPKIQEVISSKVEKLRDEITDVYAGNNYDSYLDFADELLERKDANKILAATLKYAFGNLLDEKNYSEIRDLSRDVSIDKKGKTRLFIAKGKADDMTPKKLIEMITEQVDVNERKIFGIRIFDKFSFITTPFEEAELILDAFKKGNKGSKPIVAKAKEDPAKGKISDDKPKGKKRRSPRKGN